VVDEYAIDVNWLASVGLFQPSSTSTATRRCVRPLQSDVPALKATVVVARRGYGEFRQP